MDEENLNDIDLSIDSHDNYDDYDDYVDDYNPHTNDDYDDIYSKSSSEKTVEERIKTSRSLKIKHNKWNQVDFTEDSSDDKIVINPNYYQSATSFENVEFEKKFNDVILNSKYKALFFGGDKTRVSYQTVNEMIIFCYGKLKSECTFVELFVLICGYCNIGLQAMWKRLNSYYQMIALKELKEYSNLVNDYLEK